MKALLCVSVLFLSACVSVPKPPAPVWDTAAREAVLASHPDWRFDGRVAYSHLGKGGSAQIVWQQNAERADIHLTAPLALGSVRIRLTPDSAQILDADGQLSLEGAPDDVFMRILNTPVPKSGFSAGLRAYWPEAPELTGAAMAGAVTVDGWQWRYLEWQESPVRLPKKIELRRGETRLRILIDAWQELADE